MNIYHQSYAVVKCKFSAKHFFLPRTALIPKLSDGELVHVILCAGQWEKREVEIIFQGDYFAADKVFQELESQGTTCRPSASQHADPNASPIAAHNTPPKETWITPNELQDCLVIKFTPEKETCTWSPVKIRVIDASYRVIKYEPLPDTSPDCVTVAVTEAPLSVWMNQFIQMCSRHKLIVASTTSSTIEVTLPDDFVECPTWRSPDFYREMVRLIRLFDLELLKSDRSKIVVYKGEETTS